MGNLESFLRKSFPDLDAESLAKILLLAAERGVIRYEDINLNEDLKRELLLFLEEKGFLFPFKTSRSLAWEDRLMTLKPGEKFEMPHVIRHLIKKIEESGDWNPEYAVRKYMEEIGEPHADKISAFFKRVVELSEMGRITPDVLKEASKEFNLSSEIGKIISEFKGGGIISPCLRTSIWSGFIQYKVNPLLLALSKFRKL